MAIINFPPLLVVAVGDMISVFDFDFDGNDIAGYVESGKRVLSDVS
jgi:hypothetical protein